MRFVEAPNIKMEADIISESVYVIIYVLILFATNLRRNRAILAEVNIISKQEWAHHNYQILQHFRCKIMRQKFAKSLRIY